MNIDILTPKIDADRLKTLLMSEMKSHFKAALKRDRDITVTIDETNVNSTTFLVTSVFGKFHVKVTDPNNADAFVFPERDIKGLMVAARMARRRNIDHGPFSSFFVVGNAKGERLIPLNFKVPEGALICQMSRYIEGENYREIVKKRAHRTQIEDDDRRELDQIAALIAHLHSLHYFPLSEDFYGLNEKAKNSIRTEVEKLDAYSKKPWHAELVKKLSGIYNQYIVETIERRAKQLAIGQSHPLLKSGMEVRLYSHTLKLAERWSNCYYRLRALHGDFWESNIKKTDEKMEAYDDSKIPWGEPGHDIAWWTEEDRWRYHQTGNPYWRQRCDYFLHVYKEITRDEELEEAMCLGVSLKALVKLNPRYSAKDGYNEAGAMRYAQNVESILEQGRIHWIDPVTK